MSTPYHVVLERCEDTLEAIINRFRGENLNGWQIVKGGDSDDVTLPRISIVCDEGDADMEQGIDTVYPVGNWRLTAYVDVETHYIDTKREDHGNAAGVVADIFMRDDLRQTAESIVGVVYFHAQYISLKRVQKSTNGEQRRTRYTIEVYGCPGSAVIGA